MCDADPGAHDDFVVEHGGTEIIDLVAQRDPRDLGMCTVGGERCPVRCCRVLHPSEIDDVVDVRAIVEIGSLDAEDDLVRRGGQLRRS